jgi:hypothetical protein
MKTDYSNNFQTIVDLANMIRKDIESDDDPWVGSPVQWIRSVPSGRKGKLGVRLVRAWCGVNGLSVDSSPSSEADLLINGHPAEIKFSTLWQQGCYTFQQLRDQDYEFAICLGISPADAHCWVLSKQVLRQHVIGHRAQHAGAAGSDTFWFNVYPDNPEEWLLPHGGSLQEANNTLARLTRRYK